MAWGSWLSTSKSLVIFGRSKQSYPHTYLSLQINIFKKLRKIRYENSLHFRILNLYETCYDKIGWRMQVRNDQTEIASEYWVEMCGA